MNCKDEFEKKQTAAFSAVASYNPDYDGMGSGGVLLIITNCFQLVFVVLHAVAKEEGAGAPAAKGDEEAPPAAEEAPAADEAPAAVDAEPIGTEMVEVQDE